MMRPALSVPRARWLIRCSCVFIGMSCLGASVGAQQTASPADERRMSLSVAGLAAVQSIDDTYVGPGGPYLDKGLGGVGAGVAAGVNAMLARRVTATFEVSTATVSAHQRGRLVGGVADGRLTNTALSALGGVTTPSGALQLLAGPSLLFGTPTLDDVPLDDPHPEHLAFTAGVDAIRRVNPRMSFLITMRYYYAPRSAALVQIGVGSQLVRAGVGIRVNIK